MTGPDSKVTGGYLQKPTSYSIYCNADCVMKLLEGRLSLARYFLKLLHSPNQILVSSPVHYNYSLLSSTDIMPRPTTNLSLKIIPMIQRQVFLSVGNTARFQVVTVAIVTMTDLLI